eukprot:10421944-Prorocentrum_lima.AAC.1
MHTILAVAGTPQSVFKIIPQIIDTCHVCRQFKLPSPSSAAISRLTTSSKHIAQHDLLFVDSHVD